jgi:hypothetical protein
MVFAGLLVFLLQDFVPDLLDFLRPYAAFFQETIGLEMLSVDLIATVLLASVLATFWGVTFRIRTRNN